MQGNMFRTLSESLTKVAYESTFETRPDRSRKQIDRSLLN